jgi:hypothetical protein
MAVQYAFSQITTQGLRLAVDAADPLSYPGSGTVLTDVSGNGFTGNVSSSISFAVTNRGALFSPNSSSAITFSGSAANFGTGSFTMEMAFTPQTINGQHFLYSKNSGSFPNFGAFLTGSNGSGRLVAFYNISSTISCSASTPTGSFVTGSNYIVDVTYVPFSLATYIYTNSALVTQSIANGTGSLSTSASLFLLNNSTSSNVGSVANLYNFKVYNPNLGLSFIRKNYNAQAARFGLPLATYIPPAPLLLDTYSGAAAAYSLRKLRTSYSGAAIRVRRSSDNAEADIGFDVNGELDTVTLLNHCGVGNGFVKTWYDQSGNARDATQATAVNQPQIVSSGSVLTENSVPTCAFNRASSQFIRANFTALGVKSGASLLVVGNLFQGAVTQSRTWAMYGNATLGTVAPSTIIHTSGTGNEIRYFTANVNNLVIQATLTTNLQAVGGFYNNGTTPVRTYRDAVLQNTESSTTNVSSYSDIYIGSTNGFNYFDGNISEVLLYADDNLVDNTIGIQTNQKTFYSI